LRRGPALHGFSLAPLDRYAGTWHDSSEAIGARWSDLVLDEPAPHLRVRRAIVKGATVAPKSRHGARLIPLTPGLAATLHAHRRREATHRACSLLHERRRALTQARVRSPGPRPYSTPAPT
jgi:integrase